MTRLSCVLLSIVLLLMSYVAFGEESGTSYQSFTGPEPRHNLATQPQVQTDIGVDGTSTFERPVFRIINTNAKPLEFKTLTATALSLGLFGGVSTPCVSVLVVADRNNPDVIWLNSLSLAVANKSLPLYPGTNETLRAPNDGNCDSIKIVAGASCGTACRYYAITQ